MVSTVPPLTVHVARAIVETPELYQKFKDLPESALFGSPPAVVFCQDGSTALTTRFTKNAFAYTRFIEHFKDCLGEKEITQIDFNVGFYEEESKVEQEARHVKKVFTYYQKLLWKFDPENKWKNEIPLTLDSFTEMTDLLSKLRITYLKDCKPLWEESFAGLEPDNVKNLFFVKLKRLLSEEENIAEREKTLKSLFEHGFGMEAGEALMNCGKEETVAAHIGSLFKLSAQHGCIGTIRNILGSEREISKQEMGDALYSASQWGKVKALTTILGSEREISQEMMGQTFDLVAFDSCFVGAGYVKIILGSEREISQEMIEKALDSVIFLGEIGGLKVLEAILGSEREIPQAVLGRILGFVVHKASYAGPIYVKMIKAILNSGREMSQEEMGKALKTAAIWGRAEVFTAILNSGREISQEEVGKALYLVAKIRRGKVENVTTILNSRREIPVKAMIRSLFAALFRFHFHIAGLLIKALFEKVFLFRKEDFLNELL